MSGPKTERQELGLESNPAACGCKISRDWGVYSIEYCPTHGAAPDLLAACRGASLMLRFLAQLDRESGDPNCIAGARDIDGQAESLERAIAKAEGP